MLSAKDARDLVDNYYNSYDQFYDQLFENIVNDSKSGRKKLSLLSFCSSSDYFDYSVEKTLFDLGYKVEYHFRNEQLNVSW